MGILTAPFRLVAFLLAGAVGTVARHPWLSLLAGGAVVTAAIVGGLVSTLEGLPVTSIQRGPRGVAMVQEYNPRTIAATMDVNRIEAAFPPVQPAGKPASAAYKNIQVLGNVDANEFLRLMAAMQEWIAPNVGCSYCHSLANMAEDKVYTKEVARHMIEMTRTINADWKSHVGNTGVTCGTCHRGHGAPQVVWHTQPPPGGVHGLADTQSGMNAPAPAAGYTSLPYDPLTPFLLGAAPIRVQSTQALPGTDRASVKQADWTYALMVNMAEGLGVKCNFCHNTRAFAEWDQGTPQRVTAWYGIEMVRDLNNRFMTPITGLFPPARRGPLGDVAKITCGTCHQGAYKPYYGASVLSAYPELTGPASRRSADAASPALSPGGAHAVLASTSAAQPVASQTGRVP